MTASIASRRSARKADRTQTRPSLAHIRSVRRPRRARGCAERSRDHSSERPRRRSPRRWNATGFLTIASSLPGGYGTTAEVLRCGAAKGPLRCTELGCRGCFSPAVAASRPAAIVGGTACTRWGQPGPDHTNARAAHVDLRQTRPPEATRAGNGSHDRSLQNADEGCRRAGRRESRCPRAGSRSRWERRTTTRRTARSFPIVIPRSVSISGTNYGAGPSSGSFVDGFGEDTIFEQIVQTARHSVYTTRRDRSAGRNSRWATCTSASKIIVADARALRIGRRHLGTASRER